VALSATPGRSLDAQFAVVPRRRRSSPPAKRPTEANVGILWIILIVVLVLALLGFFSRGYW